MDVLMLEKLCQRIAEITTVVEVGCHRIKEGRLHGAEGVGANNSN
jgi:hypothetical protein